MITATCLQEFIFVPGMNFLPDLILQCSDRAFAIKWPNQEFANPRRRVLFL
jgi:hypothetical protein